MYNLYISLHLLKLTLVTSVLGHLQRGFHHASNGDSLVRNVVTRPRHTLGRRSMRLVPSQPVEIFSEIKGAMR